MAEQEDSSCEIHQLLARPVQTFDIFDSFEAVGDGPASHATVPSSETTQSNSTASSLVSAQSSATTVNNALILDSAATYGTLGAQRRYICPFPLSNFEIDAELLLLHIANTPLSDPFQIRNIEPTAERPKRMRFALKATAAKRNTMASHGDLSSASSNFANPSTSPGRSASVGDASVGGALTPVVYRNARRADSYLRKMRWTAGNDRKLLLFCLSREISGKEYERIAEEFPEQPTAKAVRERVNKLRHEQRRELQKLGLSVPAISDPSDVSYDGEHQAHDSSTHGVTYAHMDGHGAGAYAAAPLEVDENHPAADAYPETLFLTDTAGLDALAGAARKIEGDFK